MKTVNDILMAKGPDVTVGLPETTALEAARLMNEAKCGSLVVMDGQTPVGIFTERDVLTRLVAKQRNPETATLGDLMTPQVTSVGLHTPVRQCAKVMQQQHIRHLAVMEEGALIGMISFRDVLDAELAEVEQTDPTAAS
jgi:CBS domain-containing protein